MRCPSCGRDNPADAAFCANCGAALQHRCPRCGQTAPADAAFCPNCGFAFASGSPPQEGPAPQPSAVPVPLPALTPAVIPEEYVGFWIRLVAAIVDGIILGVVNGLISLVSPMGGTAWGLPLLVGSGNLVINLLYYWLFIGLKGQTPGKMLVGVKVVDAQGRGPGIWKAFLREIPGKIVSTVFLFIGYLWIAFDGKKQGWHDKIAGTFVVRSKP